MSDIRTRGATSQMVRVFIPDNSVTTGAGVTGLTSASTNLTIVYRRSIGATVIYTGANIEEQTTPGTFQAPSTSSKCRFKAVDATNFPGEYEIQFHDSATIFGAADASDKVQINVYEATTTALKIGPCMKEIQLTAFDLQTASVAQTGDSYSARPIKSGVALSNLTFLMTLNRAPVTGATVSAFIKKDAGAFAACTTPTATEIGNGVYVISLTAAEMTASLVTLRFTASGCDDLTITIPVGT